MLPLFLLLLSAASAVEFPPVINSLLPSDAVSLLSFKAKADLDNKLLYDLNERFDFCLWRGVKCAQGRVVRFSLPSSALRGVFSPNTLSRLDQLRVLSLRNNSLSGPVPDLSALLNLKSLFLSHNSFSGNFPPSLLFLHRLRVLDLSFNNFTGPIPARITDFDRLSSLRLEWNGFTGDIPPLNQSSLVIFNVSANNFTGSIPVTPTLAGFGASSFSLNPDLCGEIVNKPCDSRPRFFDEGSGNATSQPNPLGQSARSGGGAVYLAPPSPRRHKRTSLILGFAIGFTVLIASLLCFFGLVRKQSSERDDTNTKEERRVPSPENTSSVSVVPEAGVHSQKKLVEVVERKVRRSGDVVFCAGEAEAYTLDQLMRASAELLGRGTVGTTYKAVLDNQLIVTVKRLDANKTAITTAEMFDRHMDAVGGLRHPNLVPIRAYFQAKGERLVIFDYQANGSLFNLIHGSRSNRAKPLHWTSCLKIAEDVAQGLAYIHQASRLIHGNLKASNVLLGADFEACLTDYSLAFLADSSSYDDLDSARYKAPESRNSSRRATSKSDVYAFGILLLELLTGKHPSQHPFLEPTDVPDWVRAMREDDSSEDSQLQMLTEIATICSLTSPEQRPAMWQVLKMIQEVKESVLVEDNIAGAPSNIGIGFS